MKIHDREKYIDLIICILFSIVVWRINGVILNPDSMEYIDGSNYRAGLYPVFLDLIDIVCGLNGVAIIQNILAGISVWIFVECFTSNKNFNNNIKICYKFFLLFLGLFSYFIISLAIGMDYWMPSSIMTEGLTYPFFFFFLYSFYNYFQEKSTKYLLFSWLWISFCIIIRKQLTIFFVIAAIFVILNSKKNIKKQLLVFLGVIISLMVSSVFNFTYNYLHDSSVEEFTTLDASSATDFVFISTYEDINLFNEDQSGLYDIVYDVDKNIGYLYREFNGLYPSMRVEYERENLFLPACYSLYNDSRLENYILWISEKYDISNGEAASLCRRLVYQIGFTLIVNHPIDYTRLYTCRIVHSLARTILPCPGLVNHNSLLIYMYVTFSCVIMILYVWLLFSNRKEYTFIIGLYCIVATILNNAMVSSFHSVEPRYFSYCTSLFYIIMFENIYLMIRKLKKHRKVK